MDVAWIIVFYWMEIQSACLSSVPITFHCVRITFLDLYHDNRSKAQEGTFGLCHFIGSSFLAYLHMVFRCVCLFCGKCSVVQRHVFAMSSKFSCIFISVCWIL
jgi:hypothetical protein